LREYDIESHVEVGETGEADNVGDTAGLAREAGVTSVVVLVQIEVSGVADA
jgi:hypothetical protein